MYCEKCGRELEPGVTRCSSCDVAYPANHVDRSRPDFRMLYATLDVYATPDVVQRHKSSIELERISGSCRFELLEGESILGSSFESDITFLEDRLVSRKHAIITVRSGVCSVRDLNSTNGTYVNGARIRSGADVPLRVGDILTLADVLLRVCEAGVPASVVGAQWKGRAGDVLDLSGELGGGNAREDDFARKAGDGWSIRPGDMLLDRYEVLAQVGEGGLCKSYLVSDTCLFGHLRLAKVLKSEKVRQDDSLEPARHMFKQEALILAALDHPGIPAIYEVQLEGDIPSIIMSHYEGKTLDRILSESGPCSEVDVLDWMRQLCDILGYLHMQDPPIVHRDVKPSNLMLRSDGRICLIDFMCAQKLDAEDRGDAMIAYTPGYAAPEQARGMTTLQSDLFSVGATMYELMAGALPDSARFDSTFDPSALDVDEAVKSIVMRCVEREPARCFQSAAELSDALAGALDALSSAGKPRRNGLFGRKGKRARPALFSGQEKEENQVLKQGERGNTGDAGGTIIAGRYRVIKTLKRTDSLEISKVRVGKEDGPWKPITDEFAEVIMKCVRTNPDDRYQTADELAAALKAVIASHGRGGMIAGC